MKIPSDAVCKRIANLWALANDPGSEHESAVAREMLELVGLPTDPEAATTSLGAMASDPLGHLLLGQLTWRIPRSRRREAEGGQIERQAGLQG